MSFHYSGGVAFAYDTQEQRQKQSSWKNMLLFKCQLIKSLISKKILAMPNSTHISTTCTNDVSVRSRADYLLMRSSLQQVLDLWSSFFFYAALWPIYFAVTDSWDCWDVTVETGGPRMHNVTRSPATDSAPLQPKRVNDKALAVSENEVKTSVWLLLQHSAKVCQKKDSIGSYKYSSMMKIGQKIPLLTQAYLDKSFCACKTKTFIV